METFPLPRILELLITGELDRQACLRFDARSETVERLAVAQEMIWRSSRLLAQTKTTSITQVRST
ncbi:hypothetical protein SAMN05216525_10154 [Bradyrhizobium sp. Gha]|nr:hypothetical protein SAMN05216525_10154 [Bradyrhizobium sp. Gha]